MILHDHSHEPGVDPGLRNNSVKAHLQELLAEHITALGDGYRLVRREYPTAIGPVDILCKDGQGGTVAVEIKRRAKIDGVKQLATFVHDDSPWRVRSRRLTLARSFAVAHRCRALARY